jgi:hypothetical protein
MAGSRDGLFKRAQKPRSALVKARAIQEKLTVNRPSRSHCRMVTAPTETTSYIS